MQVVKPIHLDFTTNEALAPVVPRSPIFSSYTKGLKGIRIEHHRQPPHEMPTICHAQHVIAIFQHSQPIRAERTLDGQFRREHVVDGDILVVPANAAHSSCWDKDLEATLVILEPSIMNHVAHEVGNPDLIQLLPHFVQPDPLIRSIGMNLKAELEVGGTPDQIYIESLTTALSVHLLKKYTSRQLALQEYIDGLSRNLLKSVLDYIEIHLEQELSLSNLSALAGMSCHYFAHLFRAC